MTCGCTQNDGGNNIEQFKDKVDGINNLQKTLKNCDISELSHILKDHLSFGNTKLPDKIAIFNMGSAKDCPSNRESNCQAYDEKTDTDKCYARKAEKQYPQVLSYRRRQQLIWKEITANQFVEAFKEMYERKRKDISFLRLNESGDFRYQFDVEQAEKIAKRLKNECDIDVYTYTASDELDFTVCDYLTVNASNENVEGYDQRFAAVEDYDEITEKHFECCEDCSKCHACMSDGGSDNIYIELH
jgi:hypothetical protein